MTDGLKKREWIERAEQTASYHKDKLRIAVASKSEWKISDTARELNRSIGRVSEDLMVCEWLKSHRNQLERFKFMSDALDYIRAKKKEMRLT